jgi:HPt (histidine-containing phosphotransfer) domain-containing protein
LTANARGEDSERCLAIGMDDYLTKPLTLVELRAALERWLPQDRQQRAPDVFAPAPAKPAASGAASEGIAMTTMREPASADTGDASPAAGAAAQQTDADGNALDMTTIDYLRQLKKGDGPTVLEKAIGMYLDHAPNALDELRRRLAEGDATAVWKIAHGLKSSSASLGAKQLAQKIGEFEGKARASDLTDAEARLAHIESEYQRVCAALQETLREEQDKCRQTA